MRETAIADLPDYREVMVSVGNNSTIRVRKQSYAAAHQDLWKRGLSPDAPAPYHARLKQ